MLVPFGQIPVGSGRLPDGTFAPFYLDRNELEQIRREGPPSKYDDARFVEEAVGDPDVIFEGLRRPNQFEGLCHSAQLTFDPDEDGDERFGADLPPRFGVVFVVFSYLGSIGHIVFDWEWRTEDAEEPGYPEDFVADFARVVWRRP